MEGRRETGTLSVEQLKAFVPAAEKVVTVRYPEIVTLAYTGMRRGALYGLDWDDLDFDNGIIHVRRSFSNGSLSNTPKTYERPVPMIPRVQDALCRHHERLRVQEHAGLEKGIVLTKLCDLGV
ncbi:MAG: tyrosine-type recombinase/integrase [Bradymonadaceae bacterium]